VNCVEELQGGYHSFSLLRICDQHTT